MPPRCNARARSEDSCPVPTDQGVFHGLFREVRGSWRGGVELQSTEGEVGRWRGAFRPFSNVPLPNPACRFPGTGLSSDYYVSEVVGRRLWMVPWQGWQTTRVLRRSRVMSVIHSGVSGCPGLSRSA